MVLLTQHQFYVPENIDCVLDSNVTCRLYMLIVVAVCHVRVP